MVNAITSKRDGDFVTQTQASEIKINPIFIERQQQQ